MVVTPSLEAALRSALRVMDEHYMAIVCGLRDDGITLNAAGEWQAAIDHFEDGELIDPNSDSRMALADDVRRARAEARDALAIVRSGARKEHGASPGDATSAGEIPAGEGGAVLSAGQRSG